MSSIYWVPAPRPTSEVKFYTSRKYERKVTNFVFSIVEEFLVLIDYCEFGNLKSYLIKNRNHFINQLNGSGEMQPEYEKAEIDTMTK
jgi:hypothetical protein